RDFLRAAASPLAARRADSRARSTRGSTSSRVASWVPLDLGQDFAIRAGGAQMGGARVGLLCGGGGGAGGGGGGPGRPPPLAGPQGPFLLARPRAQKQDHPLGVARSQGPAVSEGGSRARATRRPLEESVS